MRNLVRTPEAEQDLFDIVAYIASDSTSAALRWLEETESLFVLLLAQPEIGERYRSARYGIVRRISHGNYVVYHRLLDGNVDILRVLHGARDLNP